MNNTTKVQECPRCTTMAKLRSRDFSAQAKLALVAWEEVEQSVVEQPICDECYEDLREALVDRVDELAEFGAVMKTTGNVRSAKAG